MSRRFLLVAAMASVLAGSCAPGAGLPEVIEGSVWVLDTPRAERLAGVRVIEGDLLIQTMPAGSANGSLRVELPLLEEIGGDLIVMGVASLLLPALTRVGGNVIVQNVGEALDLSAVDDVGGAISLRMADCMRSALGPALRGQEGVVTYDPACDCEDLPAGGVALVGCPELGSARPECLQYVACQRAVDAEAGTTTADSLVDTYGEDGTCWTNSSEVAQSCADACVSALDANATAYPDISECAPWET